MTNTVSVRRGRRRGGESMGMERQRVVSIFHEEEMLLCSRGWCPQPVMNGYPGQGSAEGRGSENSLLHIKNMAQAGREGDEMGISAKDGWKG